MNLKKKKIIYVICILHSFWLIVLTYILLNQNFVRNDETLLISITSIFKRVIVGLDKKPPVDDFLFINTSYDNAVYSREDSITNISIVDRKKLIKLFKLINGNPEKPKYVLCDIHFIDKTSDDSLLMAELKKIDNIIIPYHISRDDSLEIPVFPISMGLADYETMDKSILKFDIMDGVLKSIPLLMYEKLNKAKYEKSGLLFYINNKVCLNAITLDYQIRNQDIKPTHENNLESSKYIYFDLGFLLFVNTINPEDIKSIIKNKIIVISDLAERDQHKTIYGEIPGALVLLNVYLSLVNGDNIITVYFVLYLFLAYFIISLQIFSSKKLEERKIFLRIYHTKSGKRLVKFFGYLFFLFVISMISFFLFNKHLNILILSIYAEIAESLVSYLRNKAIIKF